MSGGSGAARAHILQRLRRQQPPAPPDSPAPAAPAGPAAASGPSRRQAFLAGLDRASATCTVLPGPAALPDAVAAHLQMLAAGPVPMAAVAVAPHPLLTATAGRLAGCVRGPPGPDCRVGLTVARAALADTGTLVLASSAATPATLALLPDHLMVVLEERHLLAALPLLWAQFADGPERLPRALNLLTGPSRTADIEQTLTLGAHGPRALQVFLLESGPPAG